MTEPRARQNHRRVAGIGDMNRKSGLDQVGRARLDQQRTIDTCAQIESGRAGRRIAGQLSAQSCIENANLDAHHFVFVVPALKTLDTNA